jgi:hypothetical protein
VESRWSVFSRIKSVLISRLCGREVEQGCEPPVADAALVRDLLPLSVDQERLRSLTSFPHLNVRREVAKWYQKGDVYV